MYIRLAIDAGVVQIMARHMPNAKSIFKQSSHKTKKLI